MYLESTSFKFVAGMIAVIQFVLGALMIFLPAQFASVSGLSEAPEWTAWLFAMFGARCIGYGVGMFAALRDPVRNRLWLQTMAVIQAIDWIATLVFLGLDVVTIAQVKTAAVMPALFVAALLPAFRAPRGVLAE